MAAPMWTIALDRQITRRKFYHLLLDPSGEPVFRSKRLTDILDHLRARGITRALLDCQEAPAMVMALRVLEHKEPR